MRSMERSSQAGVEESARGRVSETWAEAEAEVQVGGDKDEVRGVNGKDRIAELNVMKRDAVARDNGSNGSQIAASSRTSVTEAGGGDEERERDRGGREIGAHSTQPLLHPQQLPLDGAHSVQMSLENMDRRVSDQVDSVRVYVRACVRACVRVCVSLSRARSLSFLPPFLGWTLRVGDSKKETRARVSSHEPSLSPSPPSPPQGTGRLDQC